MKRWDYSGQQGGYRPPEVWSMMENAIGSMGDPFQASFMPMIVERGRGRERVWDPASFLLEKRIVVICTPVTPVVTAFLEMQMWCLEEKDPNKDIKFYILDCPGGNVTAGLGLINTMDNLSCDVATYGVGCCASMGALLLASGAKGKRFVLPHTNVLIHQPLGGVHGQATDIEIHTRWILDMKATINQMLADATSGKYTAEQMAVQTERDNILTAQMAKEMGLVDHILKKGLPA